ncbi:hypothetical protein B484DRAFT_442782 [Ochromonadaceae sp. CCMP2298]|nr:hypothetical protein B484DRAFT_442782 [Ochromonadaceae sp. CCMP2298]|mmetsp:Transcript_11596/g.25818  ORF Transcript_11596/g.25818 Transcript_11596/m.25818 type:complete len:375 (-) Transcript_11596:92-1216(-)
MFSAVISDLEDVTSPTGEIITTYIVTVTYGSRSHTVGKRYSAFKALHAVAKSSISREYKFPNKSLFSNSAQSTKDRRKAGFDELLQLLVAQTPLLGEAEEFLGISERLVKSLAIRSKARIASLSSPSSVGSIGSSFALQSPISEADESSDAGMGDMDMGMEGICGPTGLQSPSQVRHVYQPLPLQMPEVGSSTQLTRASAPASASTSAPSTSGSASTTERQTRASREEEVLLRSRSDGLGVGLRSGQGGRGHSRSWISADESPDPPAMPLVGDSVRASTSTSASFSARQRDAEEAEAAVVTSLRAQLQPLFLNSLLFLVAPLYLLLVVVGAVDVSSSQPQDLLATLLLLTLVCALLRVQVLKGKARRQAGIGGD